MFPSRIYVYKVHYHYLCDIVDPIEMTKLLSRNLYQGVPTWIVRQQLLGVIKVHLNIS